MKFEVKFTVDVDLVDGSRLDSQHPKIEDIRSAVENLVGHDLAHFSFKNNLHVGNAEICVLVDSEVSVTAE